MSKSALKAVRTALDSKDFEDAAQKAKDIVKQEPQNYHAYVTLGSTCSARSFFLLMLFICVQESFSRSCVRQVK